MRMFHIDYDMPPFGYAASFILSWTDRQVLLVVAAEPKVAYKDSRRCSGEHLYCGTYSKNC